LNELTSLVFIYILVILSYFLATGFLTAYLAKQKKYSYSTWFFIGFFFSILGIITAAGLPIYEENKVLVCPDCMEKVNFQSRICKWCGHEFFQKINELSSINSECSEEISDDLDISKVTYEIKNGNLYAKCSVTNNSSDEKPGIFLSEYDNNGTLLKKTLTKAIQANSKIEIDYKVTEKFCRKVIITAS